ncbi:MAG: phage baseplate assembly protein V [Piscinibacter sp.]|uniref:phage baseplate assembly protein V n=1 Tax=Piscinibacter sp. TaxID=1903157 RepID=UPI00258F63DF|nr:phage baseplate assembly protein [Piscinibacter sp.]MCW5666469.1 phage baseplate assembly protein V [Piscinibacter sp.]
MSGMNRLLAPLHRVMRQMVARAVVSLVDDSLKLQALQVELLADEVRDDVERFQQYGFTSHPHPGAEAIAACVSGNRDHAVVLSVDDRRYRLKALAAGEVALYTDEGDKIVLKRGGVIEVTAATKVRLVTPLVECTGNVTLAGTLTATVDVLGGGKSLKNHVHSGVEPGGGNSGTPV